jgi:PAS domain S-box-containing protein
MWSRAFLWLNTAPIDDPIERRQAPLVQTMLIGLVVAATLGIPFTLNTSSEPIGKSLSLASNLLFLICGISALVVFRRGHFRRAVMLATTGLLLSFAIYAIELGLRADTAVLNAFLLPIALAGFLAGRRGLLFSMLASLMIVGSTLVLEQLAPGFVGFGATGELSKSSTIGSFLLLIALLALFIDRVSSTMRGALNDAMAREHELEQRSLELSKAKEALECELEIRRQTEVALAYERDLLHALLDNIPDQIYFKDRQSRFIRINRAQARVLGISNPEAAIGKTDLDFQPTELAARFFAEEQQMIMTRQPLIDRIEFNPTPGGHPRWFSATKAPLIDKHDHVTGIIGVSRDITARQEVERLKSEFIAVVSHELRTPLTSVHGSLRLLTGGAAGPLNPRAIGMIEVASRNTERLIQLINDLLDMEKIESGKLLFAPKLAEVVPIVEEAIEMNMAYAAQFSVTIALTRTLPGACVLVDSSRLIQVLTNLLSNAAKFSSAGGAVEVQIERCDDRVRISVSDHGMGIPQAFYERIFSKFAQADSSNTRQKSGTGLGLSIAKAIVEQMGGTIGFTSAVGIGSTFYVDLPEHV